MTIDNIFAALAILNYFIVGFIVTLVLMYIVLYIIYRISGGKWNPWKYLKWFVKNF